ncbi:hypothetical protein VTI28DRAFT_9638 [Corynascus sepedonium]
MLTPSNILVLDEATAAVDVQTDAMLQTTLRSPLFSNRTIITVAHRINTIMDSDRVVVLEKGEVVEFDTPAELIKRKGIFWGLVKEAGLLEDLFWHHTHYQYSSAFGRLSASIIHGAMQRRVGVTGKAASGG